MRKTRQKGGVNAHAFNGIARQVEIVLYACISMSIHIYICVFNSFLCI